MKAITPHLWFDKEAKEAVEFYASVFPRSKITSQSPLHGVPTPTGDCDILSFELSGQPFMAINAGPLFKFNPSVSFLVACKTKAEVDAFWAKLSEGGSALMELGEYPFSERYGWLQDKYGLSWQIMLIGKRRIAQKITPTLLFVRERCGEAEQAIKFYASVFRRSKIGDIARHGRDEAPDKAGTVKHAAFALESQGFAAMDSAHDHKFDFNEAISLLIPCETQKEIDFYWAKLSADPKAEQCGWLRDKYGVSWQVWPTALGKMLSRGTREQAAHVTQAFLAMKKYDIEKLRQAFSGGTRAGAGRR